MSYIRIADQMIDLPAPAKIPTPRTRAALENAIAIEKARTAAYRERDFTIDEVQRLKSSEPVRRGRAMAEGVDAGESPIAAAEVAAVKAQEDLEATVEAERFVIAALREAVTADRDAWTAQAAADAQKALIKLATALRMATEAGAELNVNIGVLGMYHVHERGNGGRLAPFHPRESSMFDINVGVESLRAGLSGATGELAKFKPAKPGKGKKVAVETGDDE